MFLFMNDCMRGFVDITDHCEVVIQKEIITNWKTAEKIARETSRCLQTSGIFTMKSSSYVTESFEKKLSYQLRLVVTRLTWQLLSRVHLTLWISCSYQMIYKYFAVRQKKNLWVENKFSRKCSWPLSKEWARFVEIKRVKKKPVISICF